MNYQLIFHPIADKEYSEAYQWYEERLEGLGDRFTQAIEDQLKMVAYRRQYTLRRKEISERLRLTPFHI